MASKTSPIQSLKIALQFATFSDADVMNKAGELINEMERELFQAGYDFEDTNVEAIGDELNELIIEALKNINKEDVVSATDDDDVPVVGQPKDDESD